MLSAVHVEWDPPYLDSLVCYYTAIITSSSQELTMQGMQQN